MASQTTTVILGVLGSGSLHVVRDIAANNVAEIYPKKQIVGVVPVFNQRPASATDQEWDYPYPTMTILNIYILGMQNVPVRLELQDISNQATWSTGLLTGIQQAITDIETWL